MFLIQLNLENIFQLKVSTTASGEKVAYHLYRGKEKLITTEYMEERSFTFYLEEPGNYRVRVLAQDGGETRFAMSGFVKFEGFPQIPSNRDNRPIAIWGLSKDSISAAKIFSARGQFSGIIDHTNQYAGSTLFGLPILAHAPEEVLVAYSEEHVLPEMNNPVSPFRLELGADDILGRHLQRIRAMNLYRIAHELYMEGMEKQAHFLEMFILSKFNSRIAYQAVIGEGTELGVGGIGVAIHPRAVIGKNCTIGQNSTIGGRARKQLNIEIGDNVYIGPGSKCVGGKIGSNVVIGANSVVTKEIPDNVVVAGVPAKIISRDMEDYRGYTHRTRERNRPTR